MDCHRDCFAPHYVASDRARSWQERQKITWTSARCRRGRDSPAECVTVLPKPVLRESSCRPPCRFDAILDAAAWAFLGWAQPTPEWAPCLAEAREFICVAMCGGAVAVAPAWANLVTVLATTSGV